MNTKIKYIGLFCIMFLGVFAVIVLIALSKQKTVVARPIPTINSAQNPDAPTKSIKVDNLDNTSWQLVKVTDESNSYSANIPEQCDFVSIDSGSKRISCNGITIIDLDVIFYGNVPEQDLNRWLFSNGKKSVKDWVPSSQEKNIVTTETNLKNNKSYLLIKYTGSIGDYSINSATKEKEYDPIFSSENSWDYYVSYSKESELVYSVEDYKKAGQDIVYKILESVKVTRLK